MYFKKLRIQLQHIEYPTHIWLFEGSIDNRRIQSMERNIVKTKRNFNVFKIFFVLRNFGNACLE